MHDLLLSDFGLGRIQLPGDGDCLFHGLSTILNLLNYEQSPEIVRAEICQHILTNKDYYSILKNNDDDKDIVEYVRTMLNPGVYAGEVELHAASDKYKLPIHVLSGGINELIRLSTYDVHNAADTTTLHSILLYSATSVVEDHYDLALCNKDD